MNINYLIYRNLKKNIKNYYLYVFALIFSVGLYFAFVTLQYDPAMDEAKGSVKGAAALGAASVLLVVIVAIFLLYANTIFIKRRSKEIGLFQLIGLTKGKIFRILSAENLILYFGSMVIGIFAGFAASRLILMILFKVTGVDTEAALSFSSEAMIQTVIVFAVIYVLIMIMNYTFIKRQSILSLFHAVSTTENQIKKMSFAEMLFGLLGIGLILLGYYVSTKLFSGDFTTMNELFMAMILILGSVIIGTYLFYKGSVSFLFNAIRKSKGGYLSLNDVLSLSSIMFRMKSNALLLTIITTVSALAIGLLSLSYISYYSAEKSAEQSVPNHFAVADQKDFSAFIQALTDEDIEFKKTERDVIQVNADLSDIIGASLEISGQVDSSSMIIPVISDASVKGKDVSPGETLFTGYSDAIQQFMAIQTTGEIELISPKQSFKQKLIGLDKEAYVSYYYASGGLPTAIVDQTVFDKLAQDLDPKIQKKTNVYLGIDIVDPNAVDQANQIFKSLGISEETGNLSQTEMAFNQKSNMGLMMFIVGFLGLTFLITSGCILYFKQMDEGEEEKPNYTILRKLGFTQGNLLKGIQIKQLFNFGIPLIVGLSHSYFAVKSGWFFFGTELWLPMVMVMLLYTALYSIFGLLSVMFYKRVIKEAL
ncbi:Bacitracin export permease protein BceB [Paenibacillus sp. GM2FR]|uniref:FtsX-like permease family protein n=1 Tax=Paenibacillus TaxID=44249 RepID=UPI000C27A073|nr:MULTISPECIES: ABC transporter permease [Paenibacillus]MEC0253913.1 ABC transporter permease [Paenibacillus lautus]PJN49398.1 Bacitracin export permease protein BceB [Paenibacillus sp. GM2FR]